jgi:RimJ/RimL family protein N-acetyltransferase
MRVQRVYNQELLRSVILQPRLWKAISEDGSIGPDQYYPDMESIYAIALTHEDALHGFVLGREYTDSVSEIHIAIAPDYWGHEHNVELGKMGTTALFEQTGAQKLVASIPVDDKEVLRFAQRVGFQREGVNKQSFRRDGQLLDQYYVGLTRENHG